MNRDESFDRESSCLSYRPDLGIFCGLDSVKGGAWLAIDIKGKFMECASLYPVYLGRFVAITNIRSSSVMNSSNISRGTIPLTLLKQDTFDPIKWKCIIESMNCQNFNVLFGDLSLKDSLEMYKYSSESGELVDLSRESIYSLANNDLQLDKQRRGKYLINNILSENSLTEQELFSILRDDTQLSEDKEDFKKLPIFISCSNSRGTVSSSVLMLDYEGKVEFVERSWNESGELEQESKVKFKI